MADYRRYQPRHSGGGSSRWRRFVVLGVVVVVVFLVGKSIFGGGEPNTSNDNTNESEITLVNEGGNANVDANDANSNANTNENANSNANTNTNSNTNTASTTGSETFGDDFSLDVCKTPISSFGKEKFVALTFDLSAANEDAQKVLDVLKQKNARASFFSRGTFAEKNKDFVAAVAKAGFGVYSGGYETKNYSSLSNEEVTTQITKAETAIEAATNESPKPLMRPPSGDYDNDVVSTASDAGYCLVLWTVDAFDWQDGISPAESQQRVMGKIGAGAIVALHAGYDVTPTMLPDLIDQIRKAGYTLVSLPTLLQQ